MTTALSLVLGVATGSPEASLASSARFGTGAAMATSAPVSGSLNCPQGGRIGTSGTYASDIEGNVTFALIDTLAACAVTDDHSDVWTFTSKPTISVNIEIPTNIHGDSIDVSHLVLIESAVGTVDYTTGSHSGSCQLDVSITHDAALRTPTPDSTTLRLSIAGTACGRSVTRDTTITSYTPPP